MDSSQHKDKKGYCHSFKTRLDQELNRNEARVMGRIDHWLSEYKNKNDYYYNFKTWVWGNSGPVVGRDY